MGRGDRSSILATLVVVALASTCGVSGAAQPNILLILVDDLGYHDLSMQGSPDVETPYIDRLCREGANFTEAYSVAGFCSPARAGLLSGIHPWHFGHIYNPIHDMKDRTAGMPLHITTVADTLKAAGYATMATGKWHLGFEPGFHPMHRGFDRFFGFLGGRFNYFSPTTSISGQDQYLYDDWQVVEDVTYITDDFADKSMEFMEKSKDEGKPFFIYHSVNAPHGPFEAKPEDLNPAIADDDRRAYVAMIKAVDDTVKAMRNKINQLGLKRETLIIFTNDNGGKEEVSDNYPLRDYKGTAYEGGVRVTFCMTWPKTIRWKKQNTQMISLLDVYPTLQAIAEVSNADKNPDLQGVNLMPYIIPAGKNKPAQKGVVRDYMYGLKGSQQATVRYGPWKLHVFRDSAASPWRVDHPESVLYNLDDDITESNDLLAGNVELAEEMVENFLVWYDKVAEPAFEPSFGGTEFGENTLSVSITQSPSSPKVGVQYQFIAQGVSSEGKKVYYFWEAFRREDEVFNTFNNVDKTTGVKRRKRYQRFAYITFLEPGEWIVRINLEDKGRWRQWEDIVLTVS